MQTHTRRSIKVRGSEAIAHSVLFSKYKRRENIIERNEAEIENSDDRLCISESQKTIVAAVSTRWQKMKFKSETVRERYFKALKIELNVTSLTVITQTGKTNFFSSATVQMYEFAKDDLRET